MLKRKDNEIKIEPVENSRAAARPEAVILSVLLSLTYMSVWYEALSLEKTEVNIYLAAAAAIAVNILAGVFYAKRNKIKRPELLLPCIAGAAAFICVLFRRMLMGGLSYYLSRLALAMTEATGKIYLGYDDGPAQYGHVQCFTVLIAAITAYAAFKAVKGKTCFMAVVMTLTAAAATALDGHWTGASLAFAFAMLLLIIYRQEKMCRNFDIKHLAAIALVPLAVCMTVSGAAAFLKADGWAYDDGPGDYVRETLHRLKYEKAENPMPEGRLEKALEFIPDGEAALEISMDKWEPAYLKGYVGEVYDGGSWKKADRKTYREDRDLFYWLHKSGFFGQGQVSAAQNTIENAEKGRLDVSILSGCKRYRYVPYSLSQDIKAVCDERDIGDLNVENKKNVSTYSVYFSTDSVKNSYLIQKKLDEKQKQLDENRDSVGDELSSYLKAEGAYRQQVYARYLYIPDEAADVLENCLGPAEKLSTTEAKARILEYMTENISYSQEPGGPKDEKDFLRYFLEQNKKGYSVHYATAAALMMRYYGIPARYAEGYIITSDDISGMEEGSTLEVYGNRAHAWAEYYLDGVGWIPFETVPEYLDENIYALTGEPLGFNEGEQQLNARGNGEEKQESKPPKQSNLKSAEIKTEGIFVFKAIWLVYGTLITAEVLSIAIFLKRKKLKKFLSTFYAEDINQAVENCFSYSVYIAKRQKVNVNKTFPKEAADDMEDWLGALGKEQYIRALEINQMSRYSGREVTEEERKQALIFKDTVINTYMSGRRGIGRIYDKFIKIIY